MMRLKLAFLAAVVAAACPFALSAQQQTLQPFAPRQLVPTPPPAADDDPIRAMVGRLDLEKYKATVKGLTEFGDRRQGTERNRKALDWIEAQLKSYGCTDVTRLTYDYVERVRGAGRGGVDPATGEAAGGAGRAGGTQPPAGAAPPAAGQTPPAAGAAAAPQGAGRGPGAGQPAGAGRGAGQGRGRGGAQGGGRYRGVRTRTGVNSDPNAQPDEKLRALDAEQTPPGAGTRQDVYCTKVGSTHPDEMYIIGGHFDGIGFGEAANDDGSGTALVMEIARVFSSPDVVTDRSIRFALWNNEESGLNGSTAYVAQRKDLQGKEDPAGSHKYPEPKWLGMIQHDMMMFDHGMPRPDGSMSPEQRPEANVNVEFQVTSKFAAQAQALAWAFQNANEKYATDYPAQVGQHMTNTDSSPFMNEVPALSMRENERGAQIGAGWDPQWHQPTDLFTTYSDKDFRLGLNAAQTTLSAIAQLTGATLKK